MVRLTDRPDMTLDVYRGRKTTMQCNAGTDLNLHTILQDAAIKVTLKSTSYKKS